MHIIYLNKTINLIVCMFYFINNGKDFNYVYIKWDDACSSLVFISRKVRYVSVKYR